MIDFSAHPLVETAWLAAHLSDADVRIVDARWRGDGTSRELYQHGHLPGAIHLDWYHDLSWTDARGVRNLLLPPEPFAEVMEAVGIGDQTVIIPISLQCAGRIKFQEKPSATLKIEEQRKAVFAVWIHISAENRKWTHKLSESCR